MKPTFANLETNDCKDYYYIRDFDNGIRWELQLVDTLTHYVCDTINLEYRVNMACIDPVWHDHKVIVSQFNRDDWNADADEEALEFIKAQCIARNQTSLEDFVLEHNIQTIEHERIMIAMAEGKTIIVEDYNFWGD
jgi:hypothetical protein